MCGKVVLCTVFINPCCLVFQSLLFFPPLSAQPKCDGQVLLTQVWKRLNLVECDYFGLEFQNTQSYWVSAYDVPRRGAFGPAVMTAARSFIIATSSALNVFAIKIYSC